MTTSRGAPSQVVTKYPQAIPQNQLNTVKTSDPRLLGRSRFLRDASTSPNLSPQLAGQIVEPWAPLKLQIKEADPGNTAAKKNFCERQGRCFLGCLPAARHTLNKTLLNQLLLAAQDKVLIRPLANVESIEAIQGGGYTVHYTGLEDGTEFHPTAKTVILAAGCLGSTEILLRSRDKSSGKFVMSKTLGSKFSTNGDFSGFETVDPDKLEYPIYATRGPINTSHVTFRDGKLLVNVEDAGIPAMFASLVEKTLKMLAQDNGQADVIDMLGLLWNSAQLADYSDPNTMQTEAEMLMNTCWFNCMGMDEPPESSVSTATICSSISKVRSPSTPRFRRRRASSRNWPKRWGGTYRALPLWHGLEPFVSKKLVVVHPLGGCPIGGSSTDGVVNSKGQVYNTAAGAETVYDGLYVLDSSIIPGAVAVNPTLTIVSTVARAVESIA
jgi:cholesterol oxidase